MPTQETPYTSSAPNDLVVLFDHWFRAALANVPDEPTAMTLATTSADGRPAARMVLLKDFAANGFVFYTNFDSRKGVELDPIHTPHCSSGGRRCGARYESRVP